MLGTIPHLHLPGFLIGAHNTQPAQSCIYSVAIASAKLHAPVVDGGHAIHLGFVPVHLAQVLATLDEFALADLGLLQRPWQKGTNLEAG